MKKAIALIIVVSLFFGISNCLAAKINYQDSGLGISILIPSIWTVSSNNNSRFFYGKKIILFSVQKIGISNAENKSWKKNHISSANDFAFDYATGFSQGTTAIHPTKVANYAKLPYKAARIIYQGHSGNTKIKAAQIILVKSKKLYALTGFAKIKKFKKANKKYFAPAFKSFRVL